MGFGLVIGFIELLQIRDYDYTLQFAITHTLVSTITPSSRCSVAAPKGGRSPSSGFPNYPRPQLPAATATAHNN
jgi:hypothetical protein